MLRLVLLLSFGLITFGLAPLIVRYAIDVEPMVLASLRTGFAALLLFPFWLYKRRMSGERAEPIDHKGLLLLAGIALGLHFTLWISSLHYTSVASASVLVTIHPVILIVLERVLFKRHFRPLVWIGVLGAFTGSVLLGISNDTQGGLFPDAWLGNLLAFVAAICFVLYFLLGNRIRQQTVWIDYVFYVYSSAALTCVALTLFWVGALPYISGSAVLAGVLLAIGPTILGHGSMNYAVKYISPTLLSTLILTEVVIAALGAWLLFGEVPGLSSLLAMIIIIGGVSLTWTRKQTMEKEEPVT